MELATNGGTADATIYWGTTDGGAPAATTLTLIDGTSAGTDGDGYTLNGSFETASPNPTFWEVYPGQDNHGAADAINNHTPASTDGSYTAIIGDGNLTTQAINTHQADGENDGTYTIALGDTYTLSFKHAGAFSWSDVDDIEWSLFYTSDNTAGGGITTLLRSEIVVHPQLAAEPSSVTGRSVTLRSLTGMLCSSFHFELAN